VDIHRAGLAVEVEAPSLLEQLRAPEWGEEQIN
jgi:hypothetical protein